MVFPSQSEPNLLDDLPDGTDPSAVTDWITYLEELVSRTPSGGMCRIPYVGDIKISRPWRVCWDDNDHGNKQALTILFEGGAPVGGPANCIVANFTDYTGDAGRITAVGNGSGSATFTADPNADTITFTPGPRNFAVVQIGTTGMLPSGLSAGTNYWLVEQSAGVCRLASSLAYAAAGTTINFTTAGSGTHTLTVHATGQVMAKLVDTGLSADKAADSVGELITIWNSDNAACNVTTTINKADPDGTLYVYCPIGSAAASNGFGGSPDKGTIHFRVHRPVIDVRASGVVFHNLAVRPGSAGMVTKLLNVTQSPGAGSHVVAGLRFYNTMLYSDRADVTRFRYGVALAAPIVPKPGHSSYAVNGDGIPHFVAPGNVSEALFVDTRVEYTAHGYAIAGYSPNGQSEQTLFVRSLVNFVRGLWTNPQCGAFASAAHADFSYGTIGHVYDTVYDVASAARPFSVCGDVGEPRDGARLANVNINIGNAFSFDRNHYNMGTPHPSGEWIRINNEGNVRICGNWISHVANGLENHFYVLAPGSYGESHLDISGNLFRGVSAWTDGDPAYLESTHRGPFVFSDGDTLIFETSIGSPQMVTLTRAGIEKATSQTISRDELRMFQIATFLQANVIGLKAWAREDDSKLSLRSSARGTSAWLKCNGGTFNVKLGLPTIGQNGTARKQINVETAGLLTSNLSTPNARITWDNRYLDAATGQVVVSHSFHGRHLGTTRTGAEWNSMKYATVTHNAGGTTFTFTFSTRGLPDEPDTNFQVRAVPISVSAQVATGALQVTAIMKHTNKIDFTVAADPATGNVTWGIEVFR